MKSNTAQLSRRRTLALLGSAGAATLGGLYVPRNVDAAAVCVNLAGAQTEGPYWVDENLNRSDIRIDPSDGSVRPGVLLNLTINVQEVTGTSACGPLAGARVDIWHCDAGGTYSDEAVQNSSGKKYLRGYQVTDDAGSVQFVTVYPGWYSGRTAHIHVRIRTYSGATKIGEFVAQLFFDDTVSDAVYKLSPYNTRANRDTRNTNDMVLTGTNNGAVVYVSLAQNALGYTGTATMGVNVKTAAVAAPAVSAGGAVNGASYASAISPGSWVAIFGQNLAAATHTLTSADLVNGALSPTLSGISVTIDNQPAFPYFVSPTQVNVQAPASANSGTVPVVITNSAGASNVATVTMQPIAPAFFATAGYVAAVRVDGIIINGTGAAASGYATAAAAKAGDILELYGTGFGPTQPAVAPGVVYQGAADTANAVTVTIGGVAAPVSFAGVVGTGLYQINVTVPAVAAGDQPVVAKVSGFNTPNGVSLKITS